MRVCDSHFPFLVDKFFIEIEPKKLVFKIDFWMIVLTPKFHSILMKLCAITIIQTKSFL